MSIGLTGSFVVKEFKATCPVTGMTFMRAYSNASSRNAKRFLHYLIEQTPFEYYQNLKQETRLSHRLNSDN